MHTTEPWLNNDGEADAHPAFHDHQFGHSVAISEIDYGRACECVNAMAGVKDPAAFLAKVREFVNCAHGEHTGEDLRGYAKDLAALLPAE